MTSRLVGAGGVGMGRICEPGVQLRTYKPHDKYGRYPASVATDDGDDLATALLAAGLAVAYYGGPR